MTYTVSGGALNSTQTKPNPEKRPLNGVAAAVVMVAAAAAVVIIPVDGFVVVVRAPTAAAGRQA